MIKTASKNNLSWSVYILMIMFLISISGSAEAATITWTGTLDTDWHNILNWDTTVPVAGDIAVIPNVANDPIISSAQANAYSVVLRNGAFLNITSSGSLNSTNVTINGVLGIAAGIVNVTGYNPIIFSNSTGTGSSGFIEVTGGTLGTNSNYSLDLGNSLKIVSGIVNAPNGSGSFTWRNGFGLDLKTTGTFNHNTGVATLTAGGCVTGNNTQITFNNFTITGGNFQGRCTNNEGGNVFIENTLAINAGSYRMSAAFASGNLTLGTSTSSGQIINGGVFYFMLGSSGAGFVGRIDAVNPSFPWTGNAAWQWDDAGGNNKFFHLRNGIITNNIDMGTGQGNIINTTNMTFTGTFGINKNTDPQDRLFVNGNTQINGALTNQGGLQIDGGNLTIQAAYTMISSSYLNITANGLFNARTNTITISGGNFSILNGRAYNLNLNNTLFSINGTSMQLRHITGTIPADPLTAINLNRYLNVTNIGVISLGVSFNITNITSNMTVLRYTGTVWENGFNGGNTTTDVFAYNLINGGLYGLFWGVNPIAANSMYIYSCVGSVSRENVTNATISILTDISCNLGCSTEVKLNCRDGRIPQCDYCIQSTIWDRNLMLVGMAFIGWIVLGIFYFIIDKILGFLLRIPLYLGMTLAFGFIMTYWGLPSYWTVQQINVGYILIGLTEVFMFLKLIWTAAKG